MSKLFASILKEQLSSVEFVQDYLQLHFDGNTLTYYVWPQIIDSAKSYSVNDLGYRDTLCNIISHVIEDVLLIENDTLILFFNGNYKVKLNLSRDNENIDIREFLYFRGVNKEWFVLD